MERYINSFATENDIKIALQNGELLKPYVAYIEDADRIDWNSKEIVDYTTEYLTFNILSAGTINWTASKTNITKTIDYKLNNGEWVSITSNTSSSAPTINVAEGDKIQFRGNNAAYAIDYSYYNSFGGSASFEAEGNIMSLINPTDFSTLTTLERGNTFNRLFYNCTRLTSAENLILPVTTLAGYCYQSMFGNCSSLTVAPKLPATTLAGYCYGNMFDGCKSLTTAPVLPATILATYCYTNMFQSCTKLTTAPALPATTLAGYCYSGMFNDCTSLKTAPELPATTLAPNCYKNMFSYCASLATAPKLPSTTLSEHCYYNMFAGCSSLTTAPELPANTLVYGCYSNMFQYCTKLNYIKCLATDISAGSCTSNWVQGVAKTGTFVKASSMASWSTGTNGIPTGWTVQDA